MALLQPKFTKISGLRPFLVNTPCFSTKILGLRPYGAVNHNSEIFFNS